MVIRLKGGEGIKKLEIWLGGALQQSSVPVKIVSVLFWLIGTTVISRLILFMIFFLIYHLDIFGMNSSYLVATHATF